MDIRLTDYTPAHGRTLQALLRVVIDGVGIEIRDIGLHEADGKRWIVMPRRKIVNQGDYRYFSYVIFKDKSDFQNFTKQVLAEVAQHKGLERNGADVT